MPTPIKPVETLFAQGHTKPCCLTSGNLGGPENTDGDRRAEGKKGARLPREGILMNSMANKQLPTAMVVGQPVLHALTLG